MEHVVDMPDAKMAAWAAEGEKKEEKKTATFFKLSAILYYSVNTRLLNSSPALNDK